MARFRKCSRCPAQARRGGKVCDVHWRLETTRRAERRARAKQQPAVLRHGARPPRGGKQPPQPCHDGVQDDLEPSEAPEADDCDAMDAMDGRDLPAKNILRQMELFALYMRGATEAVNAPSTKRTWYQLLDKFLTFVQGRLESPCLVTLDHLLETKYNAPFREVCAREGTAQLEVFQRLLNKLLLKSKSEAALVNRETVRQLQRANSKRLRESTRLRRRVKEVAAMNATAPPLSFVEVRGQGLAHAHAIMHELRRPLLDVIRGNRRRLSYQDRSVAAGLLATVLALKKPSRGINLAQLTVSDREAMTNAHENGTGIFTVAQGKESCRDVATFFVVDADVVVFLDFHVEVVRPALIASCLQGGGGRGKQKPLAVDVAHAAKIYSLPADDYFLQAKRRGVPVGLGRNQFRDIFEYFSPPKQGWRTKGIFANSLSVSVPSHCHRSLAHCPYPA
jgi:hypothetical protein